MIVDFKTMPDDSRIWATLKPYENLLEQNPNDLAVLENYGSLLSQTKEFKKADDIFKK